MCLSCIIVITNSDGDNAYSWNILFWIITSAKLFPPTVYSTLKFFTVSSINFMTLSAILYILRESTLRDFFVCRFVVNPRHRFIFFVSFCLTWGCTDQCTVDIFWHMFPCGILYALWGTVSGLLANSKSPHYFVRNILLIWEFFTHYHHYYY